MKILFAIQGFNVGGVVSSFLSLARLLEGEGHVVRVVLSQYNGRKPMSSVAVPERYVLGWLPDPAMRSRFLSGIWFRLNVRFRWKPFFLLKTRSFTGFDYDCFVLFHGQEMVWRWYRNRPSVMWIHDIWGAKPGSRIVHKQTRELVLRSKREAGAGYDRHVAVTPLAAASFVKVYDPQEPPVVINNLVDIPGIVRCSEEPQDDIVPGPAPDILYVGRLSWEKGVDRLLEAAGRLRLEGRSFRLWIVGGGDDASTLRRLSSALGLDSCVRFLGIRNNPWSLMKAADLLVLPSRAEGLGLVLWESLVCGTPVLATDCGGTRDALRDGKWGVLVENTTEGIETGLRAFLETGKAPDPAPARRGIEEADAQNRAAVKALFSDLDPARRIAR